MAECISKAIRLMIWKLNRSLIEKEIGAMGQGRIM